MSRREIQLGDAIHVKHGFAFKGEYFSNDGTYVVLTPGNFNEEGGFRLRPGKDRFYTGDIPEDYILGEGDLIVAMTEQGPGLLGSSALIPENDRYLHNQRLGLIRDVDDSTLDKDFLYYLFNTRSVRGQIRGSASGTKVRHTAPERIYRVRVLVPSEVAEQRKIAAILFAYDDLIENNRRRIQLLEQATRLLYKEWFVHLRFPGHEHVKMIDGVPEGWEGTSVGEIATIFRGKSYKSSELRDEGGKDFVNLKCIQRFGGFRTSGLKHFEGEHREHHLVSAGDIVMAVTDMTRNAMIVAQAARVPQSIGDGAIYSMDLVKIVPGPEIDPNWLYFLFRYSGFSYAVREHATGTNVLHLKPKYIEQWKTPLPPSALRHTFSETMGPMLAQQDQLELQCDALARARNLLLPRLMNGEITV